MGFWARQHRADNTLRRKAGICAGDTVTSDAFDPSAEWDGFANDTVDGLGAFTPECDVVGPDDAPSVTRPSPWTAPAPVSIGATLSVTFSEAVSFGATSYSLSCSSSGPKAAAVSGGGLVASIPPQISCPASPACSPSSAPTSATPTATTRPTPWRSISWWTS